MLARLLSSTGPESHPLAMNEHLGAFSVLSYAAVFPTTMMVAVFEPALPTAFVTFTQ